MTSLELKGGPLDGAEVFVPKGRSYERNVNGRWAVYRADGHFLGWAAECADCEGRGRCARCSGEGCSMHGMAHGGCNDGNCVSCKGTGRRIGP